jgi:uncharacterized protein YPO0396
VSSAYEKEEGARILRLHAALIERALDALPALSAEAWDCPSADAFVAGLARSDAALQDASVTMRSVAAALDASAAAQRTAEAAAAETAVVVDPSADPVPDNVF